MPWIWMRTVRPALAALAAAFLLAGAGTSGEPPLTDEERKSRVYAMYADYKREFPEVVDISAREAMSLAEKGGVVFVDTRTPEERKVSVIPGAVPQDAYEAAPERFAGKTVVAYCTISYRSGLFARDWGRRGTDVRNLAGGILAWTLEGGTVSDGDGPTRRLHVYGRKWDLAPEGYETVVFGWWRRWP